MSNLSIKKTKRSFWEKLFYYPSFVKRFTCTLVVILLFFCAIACLTLLRWRIVDNISDQVAILNFIVQIAILVLAIFATYFALRQLVETRFVSLDEAGMRNLKSRHYLRAFEKWKEAFYIKSDATVFANMCEALLLLEDYDTFDEYMRMLRSSKLKARLFQETSDHLILLYLKAARHLLVKNQGQAENHLSSLVALTKKEKILRLDWNFGDLRVSPAYQNLDGECKEIVDNLLSYLSMTMIPEQKTEFEAGNYANQITNELTKQKNKKPAT